MICKKCGGEDSMVMTSELKWGKKNKWQHFLRCQLCGYETQVD